MTFACLLFLLTDEASFWDINIGIIQEWTLDFVDIFQSSVLSKLLQNELAKMKAMDFSLETY